MEQSSSQKSVYTKNLLSYMTKFMLVGDISYQRMMSRLITIWHKGHQSLDRDGLGATIYDMFKKKGDTTLSNTLLAVSNSAKERFVVSGDLEKFINRAMLVVDGIFVDDLKESKIAVIRKKDDVTSSRISLKKDVAKTSGEIELRHILIVLKSFFHLCQSAEFEFKHLPNSLVVLIEKLFQVVSTKRRQHEFTELKKVISNVSCNDTFSKEIFSHLLSPKLQFIP
jgi:hypothetical protein